MNGRSIMVDCMEISLAFYHSATSTESYYSRLLILMMPSWLPSLKVATSEQMQLTTGSGR